ncbi:MAG: DUF255 domain-containing protein [Bacillota bacterium]
MKAEFKFSPRPNRAHEINWRPWDDMAFTDAVVEDKPVFLSIAGAWCRMCHLMDETSYSDPEIIAILNEKYIPVRVDGDRRPDVNQRYSREGWPSTVILTPGGRTITGGTYVAPEQLKQVLEELIRVWREKREEFRKAEMKPPKEKEEPAPAVTLDVSPHERTVKAVKRAYDSVYGGFGREMKFPFPQALELALHAVYTASDEDCRKIASDTLTIMAGGGMYDSEEGGFFRCSANREWTAPRYEKILGENAALLFVYLRAFQITGELRFTDVARDVLSYLEKYLLTADGAWAGSQDADFDYYGLPLAERRRRGAPPVDHTVFINQNGILVSALALASWVLEEDQWQSKAIATAAVIWRKAFREGRGMAHYFDADGPEVFGRLSDQAAFGRACLSLYSGTGDRTWLERSATLAEFVLTKLRAPDGAFCDGPPDPGGVGSLSRPLKNIGENGLAARWLLELAALSGDGRYKDAALTALKSLAPVFEREGLAGADFALATWEAIHPWTVITVAGKKGKKETALTVSLHHRALAVYVPAKTVRFFRAEDAAALAEAGLAAGKKACAVVCKDGACLPPVSDPAELTGLLHPKIN